MKAAWYEKQGPASEVLRVGEMGDPRPGSGEVRISLYASGVNPGDVKKRQDTFGIGMAFPRVIPHSDGAGIIDEVGEAVPAARIGERVWCYGAQSYRAYGTAAAYTVVPAEQAVPLPENVSFDQGACLGIPGITAYRAVFVAGPVEGKTVLVQGGAGAVGLCAVALAKNANARVIATVRSANDVIVAERAGAVEIVCTDGLSTGAVVERIRSLAPDGVHHVVEVAFHSNIASDEKLLVNGGSVATYATGDASRPIPFWPLVFKNIRLFFLGSDDFPPEARTAAAAGLNRALEAGWSGFEIAERYSLENIAAAHEFVEHRRRDGRAVVQISHDSTSS